MFLQEAQDADLLEATEMNNGDFSFGDGARLDGDGDYFEWDFTPQYDIPSRASFNSQIYEVTPGSDIDSFDSFWAVLTGGSDESDPPRGIERVSAELVFLADGSQYSNRSALKNDIGVSSI